MSSWIEALEGGRCNKWRLHYTEGSRASRVHRSRRFDGGKREANTALKAFEAECKSRSKSNLTIEEYATQWNDARLAAGVITTGTHDKYVYHFKTVLPLLPIRPQSIKPIHITEAYGVLRERGLSGTYLLSIHNSLKRTFNAAVQDAVLSTSPMAGVDAPRADTKERRALSPDAIQGLYDALNASDAHEFAIKLIIKCGLRVGECCALRWQDVDGSYLHIPRSATKTDAGVRSLPLSVETQSLIGERKELIESNLARASSMLNPSDALCCGLDGRPLTVNALKKWWQRHRATYGLDGWTIHELRHTYLTNLAQANIHPSIMQRLAGHSSMRVSMEIYTHVQDSDMLKAVDALENLRQCAPRCAPFSTDKEKGQDN